jgi:hypothetical protein
MSNSAEMQEYAVNSKQMMEKYTKKMLPSKASCQTPVVPTLGKLRQRVSLSPEA